MVGGDDEASMSLRVISGHSRRKGPCLLCPNSHRKSGHRGLASFCVILNQSDKRGCARIVRFGPEADKRHFEAPTVITPRIARGGYLAPWISMSPPLVTNAPAAA
jgi:hypothetical protein